MLFRYRIFLEILEIILKTKIGPTLYGKISKTFNSKAETTYVRGIKADLRIF
jgi:hypothetical protein